MSVLVDTSVWIRFLSNRSRYAAQLDALLSRDEVVTFVRDRKLHGRGIGWIDAHLLASALVGRVNLWTVDPSLETLAKELDVAYE